jgi:hypothetical protein
MKKFRNISLFAVVISCLAIILSNIIYSPHNILSWDVFGYYLYLPLVFIYNDLGMNNVEEIYALIETYKSTATFYQGIELPSGGWVMKYSAGMALLYLPFFLIGHVTALVSHYPADGFSLPYQYALLSGGILYTVAGIIFLRKLLLKYFSDVTTALVIFIIIFGTNFFFHTGMHGQNAMTHNYLFTLYVFILLLTGKWYETRKMRFAVLLAIVCGLMILARPSEVVCLFIPALWGITGKPAMRERIKLLKEQKKQVLLFILILLLIGSVQFIYWKLYTGLFFYDSYGGNPGEGFDLLSPYTWQVLFSFRKGWLIYTPVMILAGVNLPVNELDRADKEENENKEKYLLFLLLEQFNPFPQGRFYGYSP